MIIIENRRPGLLLLPQSKMTLKPSARVNLPEVTPEITRAVKAGWVRIVEPESSANTDNAALAESPISKASPADNQTGNSASTSADSGAPKPAIHDWLIDYSQTDVGNITITDRTTGRSIVAEIAEKKGEQHFTLKTLGTVKGQQLWPTAQALERFDAAE